MGLFKRKKTGSDPQQPTQKPCTCGRSTWTDRQRKAFGELPVKFSDCPRHG